MNRGEPYLPPHAIPAEQALIGACLVQPQRLAEARSAIVLDDIGEPLHRRILETLDGLRDQGRSPSIEALIAALGNDEITPGLPLREYLNRLVHAGITGELVPWRDAVETIRDHSMRSHLAGIGTTLSAAAYSGRPVAEIASDATAGLDSVLSAARQGKRLSYGAGTAAEHAIVHLDSAEQTHPTTGLVDLDRLLGGWPRGELSILAARPGLGKSTAAVHSAVRIAKSGRPVLVWSLEMTERQIGARLLADQAYIANDPIQYEDILSRRIRDTDMRQRKRLEAAREALAELPLTIEEQRGVSMSEIVARVRKRQNELARQGQELGAIFVDHLGLVRPSGRYAGNRVREVAEISDGLATMAKDLDVAVIALCQLNRAVEGRENKRPSLADLRDSGAIEEDASNVTFLYRAAYYLESRREDSADLESARIEALERCRHDIEFVVAKNRNGRVGSVRAYCDMGASVIRNAEFGGR